MRPGDTSEHPHRERSTATGLALALVTAAVATAGCGATSGDTGTLSLAGDVRAEVRTVVAPSIGYPALDPTVGLPLSAADRQAAKRKKAASAASGTRPVSRLPVVSGFLAHVYVSQGSHVTTGQALAQLDSAMLDLGVAAARAEARRGRADVDVVRRGLTDVADKRGTLADARSKLLSARRTLLSARGTLRSKIAQLEGLIARMPRIPPGGVPPTTPGGPPPGGPPPGGPGGAPRVDPRAALARLRAALAKVETGLRKVDSAFSKLRSGSAKLADARTQLLAARDTLDAVADGYGVAIDIALLERDRATVRSPGSGVVVFARRPGTAVMAGAPLVRYVPDGPAHVDTYVTPDQLARLSVGDAAAVTFDSAGGRTLSAHVSAIGADAVFPPTGFPTGLVHMTRANRVTLSLDPGGAAPRGTPVDVTIRIAGATR